MLDLIDAIQVYVRYELPHPKAATRREYNMRAGRESPPLIVPDHCLYIWDLFFELNDGVDRTGDGYCRGVTWADLIGFQQAKQITLTPDEIALLKAMDVVFCDQMNAAIAENAEARRAEAEGKGKR